MKKMQKLLDCSKIVILFVSLIYLVFVFRYFQIRPQFRYRGSLTLERSIPKNQALIYMKRISQLVMVKDSYANINISQRFKYFDLLMISATRSLPMCQSSHSPILILSANYKQVSDSYFTFFQEMQRYETECFPPVYALKRKDHLLMNSDLLINQYVEEINEILNFFNDYQQYNLSILTFEQGSILLLKAMLICKLSTIKNMNKIVFINMFNPNMKVLFQSPYKYIHTIQSQLMNNSERMKLLNDVRIIQLSTIKERNSEQYPFEDENMFSLMFDGKKLKNTVKLSSRYIKNIYCLLHERDYFLYTQFSTVLAKFFIRDHDKPYTIKEIQYFFYYGDSLYGNISNIFFNRPIKNCLKVSLSYDHNEELADTCIRLSLRRLKKFELSSKAILIHTEGKIEIYNDGYEHLDTFDTSTNITFYLIQKFGDTTELFILNDEHSAVTIQIINVYHPHKNPFLTSEDELLQLFEKQQQEKYSLITTCPSENRLLYPLHIDRRGIFHQSIFIAENQNIQCYLDANQVDIVEQNFIVNWDIQRNIVLFTLICSHIKKKRTFERFFIQFLINACLSYLTIEDSMFFVNFLLLALVIIIQKLMDLVLFMSYYLHEHLQVKYQKIMLYSTLVVSLLKNVFEKQINMNDISPWKIFILSVIFLINPANIIILLCKMYFLAQNIAFNHNDVMQVIYILLWIYNSLLESDKQNGFTKKQEKKGIPQILLVTISALLVNGPTIYMDLLLNGYIFMKFCENKIKDK